MAAFMNIRSAKFYPERKESRDKEYHGLYRFSEENVEWTANHFLRQNWKLGGLSPKKQMQIFLRFLSDPGFQMGIGKEEVAHRTTICKTISHVLPKIVEKAGIWIKFPAENSNDQAINEWAQLYRFPCAFGAIDCTHVPIATWPESPVYRPSEVEYKLCNEARKSYGVTTDEERKQNLEQREKNTLLNEVFIPLNNSYTKSACFGIDVYNNFNPCLKIIKQGFNCAIQFTLPQFKTFIDVLDDIINALRYKDTGSYELEDYIVLTTDLNAERFAPKKSDEKYHLYLGFSSLQSIRKMKNYFISRMKKLEKCDFQFNQFIENVVDVIDK
ncbi:hypothetical protein FQR65_LT16417 [Abscondita terminalis]|nr:hypothetical protein FQR65_LT16417 [Abscondita terminalis]